jgi:hypothetical protein
VGPTVGLKAEADDVGAGVGCEVRRRGEGYTVRIKGGAIGGGGAGSRAFSRLDKEENNALIGRTVGATVGCSVGV